MRFLVITKRHNMWENGAAVLRPHGVTLLVQDADDVLDADGGLRRCNYDFVVSDCVDVYKYLPPQRTILIFSSQGAIFFSSFLLDVFAYLSSTGEPPTIVFYLSGDSSKDDIKKLTEELGYNVAFEDDNLVTSPHCYAVISDANALKRLAGKISGAFLLPNEGAKDAFASFLEMITFYYLTPEGTEKLFREINKD